MTATIMSIPIYVPQTGGNIPIYDPSQTEGASIPYIYQPRQRGAGGFRNMGNQVVRLGRHALEKVKEKAVERGTEALKNVTQDVIEGKDLTQAVQDEGLKMRVDLKRKANAAADRVNTVKRMKKGAFNKNVINALFD